MYIGNEYEKITKMIESVPPENVYFISLYPILFTVYSFLFTDPKFSLGSIGLFVIWNNIIKISGPC